MPSSASPDAGVLVATRGVRGFVDGAVSVTLSAYLTVIGFSGLRIGVIVSGMLLGSAVLTYATGAWAHRASRLALLRGGALLMIATGLVYSASTTFVVLLVVGALGTMNPTSGDVSVFQPIEQSLLPATVEARHRPSLFVRYTFVGALAGALGSLAAGFPAWLADHTGMGERRSLGLVFAAYSFAGVASLGLYRRLAVAAEGATERPTPLGVSRPIVHQLAALFSLDAFAGGFTVQSLLALWLFRRFHFSVASVGWLFLVTGVLSAASGFVAVRLAARVGPVRAMACTHLPAQVLLVSAALMPNARLAVACLVGRSLLSSMDVPVRNAYVMSVVTPPERAAAAAVTNVPRSLASAVPPLFAGWLLDRTTFGWPLVIAGVLKATYDVLLLVMFAHAPVHDEPVGTAGRPA